MRDDLTSNIALAITEAIEFHQKKQYYFNEADSVTFSTVASQYEYTSSDNANIPNLFKMQAVFVTVGSQNYEIVEITPEQWRILYNGSTSGQPYNYTYFNRTIRLFPTPNDAWTVRVQGQIKKAEPASDSETDNIWMTDMEAVIRHRAKGILWRDVLYDTDKAAVCFAAEDNALTAINDISDKMRGTGRIVPMDF